MNARRTSCAAAGRAHTQRQLEPRAHQTPGRLHARSRHQGAGHLHSWMIDLMRPIPEIHLALVTPRTTLAQSVLHTICEEPPTRERQPEEAREGIPVGWPTGTLEQVDEALEQLVRWHMCGRRLNTGPPAPGRVRTIVATLRLFKEVVMSSSRRVRKGPGRRPMSAKRQRFMELRAQGWSIRGAAREVGVSRAAAANWTRGYKVYRHGQVVGFVPPLDRLEVREISARFLSQDERVEIADLHHAGLSVRAIAARIGRAPSTVSRELRRNASAGRRGGYRPFDAHRRACARRARNRGLRVDMNPELGLVVSELLAQRWSPEQISRYLRRRFQHDPDMTLCHESIYRAVYRPGSGFMRPTPLAPQRRSPLRTGREHRRAQQHAGRRRARFEQPMRTVHERPFKPEDRSQAGHWEGDLIVGKNQGSAIGTLVERHTRMVRLLHLPSRDSESLHAALRERLGDLPPEVLRSITWDQGTEMARHTMISKSLGVPVFFCDSHSPWQRGSNENTNGLLRDYFPKGTDLSVHSRDHLAAVENELNHRPRIVLGDRTPLEVFTALVAS
jgi:IS30 family transposase